MSIQTELEKLLERESKQFTSIADIDPNEIIESILEHRERSRLSQIGTYFERLRFIRKYYLEHSDKLIAFNTLHPTSYYNPYAFEWSLVFSKMESWCWNDLRCMGHIVLYPQYPALNYFLDFANPLKMIAVEIDGKDFHNHDRDFNRDRELTEAGWEVIRITGSEMWQLYKDWADFDERDYYSTEELHIAISNWILFTGNGVLQAIKTLYFGGNIYLPEDDEDWFRSLCRESINNHKLYKP